MRPEIKEKLLQLLKGEEGFKQFPYHDTKGILTIGYGRNLQAKGISIQEALYLLDNDVKEAEAELIKDYPHYLNIDVVRQAVLLDMCFNMGIKSLLGFKSMLAHLESKDFDSAAQDMLHSSWHTEVGHRAEVWARIMKNGEF